VLVTGVDVDHPPPDGKVAGLLDEIDPVIAGRRQPVGETTLVEFLAASQALDPGRDRLRERHGGEKRSDRGDHDADLTLGHLSKQPDELESGSEGGFGALIGGGEITGNPPDAGSGCEELESGSDIVHLGDVGDDDDGESRPPASTDQGREGQRSSARDNPAEGQSRVAAIEGLDQRGEIRQRVLVWRTLHFGVASRAGARR
jgi:hypothetical protein